MLALKPLIIRSLNSSHHTHDHHSAFHIQRSRLVWQLTPKRKTLCGTAALNKVSKVGGRSKVAKSNEELCDELREFVDLVGLPEGYVPTFKELSEHGRKDLAYIVRRRGYKLITEILATSSKNEIAIDISSSNSQGPNGISEDDLNHIVEELSGGVSISSEYSLEVKHLSYKNDGLDHVDSQLRGGGSDTTDEYGIYSNLDETNSVGEESQIYDTGNGSVPSKSAWTSKVVAPEDEAHSPEGLHLTGSEKDVDLEVSESDAETEISRLKVMLHEQDLELTQLKKQIEKEKHALSTLQTKAEYEIGRAKQIILAKNEELQAAEEGLAELKEVSVEFWGDGHTVEVAGNFNGWHHPIGLELSNSSTKSSTESRTQRQWSTTLWLYPGVYEIKFVVDGHWTIDPQRETGWRDGIQNNIIRVNR